MGWRGEEDSARIAAANLLDNYREQWNDNFEQNQRIGKSIDEYIFNLMTGQLEKCTEIISILNESVMVTPASKTSNQYLAFRIKEYIRHISRRKPKSELTIKHLRTIQQAYLDAISAHFVHQSQLVSMVLIEVFSNISLISRTTLVPKALKDDMEDFMEGEEYMPDEDEKASFKERFRKKIK